MTITFQGKPITLKGTLLHTGDTMPEFTLTDNALNPVHSRDLTGTRVFLALPSLDTGVCDLEVKTFHQKASELKGVFLYAVSLDLPFAQTRWCAAAGVDKVKTLSDYRDRSFGQATGTLIDELALLTRAVFVVNQNNQIVYAEYVPEITDHPNYQAVYQKLNELVF